MDISLRRIKKEDAVVLSEISKITFFDTFMGTCTDQDMDDFLEEYYNVPRIIKELEDEEDYFYFAEVAEKAVGYIRFKEDYEGLEKVKQWKALELKRLYILKEYHGKGIAQKMMDFFIEYALKKEYKLVWLGVWEYNYRAQRFYDKQGFKFTGDSHPFPIGNTPQTDLWYWRFL